MAKKYIEAELLKGYMYTGLTGNDLYKPHGIENFVNDLPAADVQEVVKEWCFERNCVIVASEYFPRLGVRRGKWLKSGQSLVCPDKFRNYFCSVCGVELDTHIRKEPNYCPNCGSRMDLEGNEDE